MRPVILKRPDRNDYDNYVLVLPNLRILPNGAVVPATITTTVRITSADALCDFYAEEWRAFEADSRRPVHLKLAGRRYTFERKLAEALYATIHSWFWDYASHLDEVHRAKGLPAGTSADAPRSGS